MINKVSDLADYDRNMTVGEVIEQFKKERPHICPKCNGTGEVYNDVDENYDLCGPHSSSGYIKCDICSGHGRTIDKYVPVYKLIGYKTGVETPIYETD